MAGSAASPVSKTPPLTKKSAAIFYPRANDLTFTAYHILKDGVVFKDPGADYNNQFNRERKINACLRKLEKPCYRTEVAAT